MTWELTCEGSYWSGLLWADGGCLASAVVDVWAPLRHERHELDLADDRVLDGQTWVLGPILTETTDWSPGTTSAFACPEHADLTFALLVQGTEQLANCTAWGPQAGDVGELPGARLEHAGCGVR